MFCKLLILGIVR
jgi:ElaB/YqjD/DUF883 family membrane-anchored ribosome-binding protein